jgi:ubiquitin conjugation factor E4 B
VSTPSIVAVLAASPTAFLSPPRHVFQEKPPRLHGDFAEFNSILGPLFRLSTIPDHSLAPTPNLALLANAFHSRREAEQNVSFLRTCLRQHHDTLADVMKAMAVKPESRECLFQWVASTLQANHERTQEMFRYQFAHMHMSSDGFMMNLLSALLRMCSPFLDPSQPNFQKIDYSYLLSDKRMQASALLSLHSSRFSYFSSTDTAFPRIKTPGHRRRCAALG